jgi:tetratricopeptide (TPR) repeat protein
MSFLFLSEEKPAAEVAVVAAGCFRRAVDSNPHHVVARLNLVEALVEAGRVQEAMTESRAGLALLDRIPLHELHGGSEGHYPPGRGFFGVEWARAGWLQAGNSAGEGILKRDLLRWRFHILLGELGDDLAHRYEAVLLRPDMAGPRAALGCALARAGRPQQAVEHLRHAAALSPFDGPAARALAFALQDTGDSRGYQEFTSGQRHLSRRAPSLAPPQAWFWSPPPAENELVSIVITCGEDSERTLHCFEQVLRHTRPPYELLLILPAGETSRALAEQIRARTGPLRVYPLFAEGNVTTTLRNRAGGEARGRFLVLLTDGVTVYPGWLEGLVRGSLHEWPRVGLVGPVSNQARPAQQVAPREERPSELEEYASRLRQENQGQATRADRLAGFCMLLRREVWDQVGGFDEYFESEAVAEEDLVLRVRETGQRLLVSLEVFVHCSEKPARQSETRLRQQLERDLNRFHARWGSGRTGIDTLAKVSGPGPTEGAPASGPSLRGGRKRVSLCVIVKDEQDNLPECLRPLVGLVDEVIVGDTGSSDRTREVAASLGARVIDIPWQDSFAVARNQVIDRAAGEWIFWVDADDRIDPSNLEKLTRLFEGLGEENVAYSMKCLCLPDPVSKVPTVVDHVRLFRRLPGVRWEYRVHEQILPSVRRGGGEVRWSDVVVTHTGYQDPALRARKLRRDLRLLEMDRDVMPDEPFTNFNLGSVYQELGRHEEAIACLRKSLERSRPSDSIVRKLYALISGSHASLGRLSEALAACREGRAVIPDDPELVYREALLHKRLGNYPASEACCWELLSLKPGPHFASVSPGLRGWRGRHELADVLYLQRMLPEARAQWLQVVREEPAHVPSWLGLAQVALEAKDYGALEEAAVGLETQAGAPLDAALLRAQGLLARKQFAEARELAGRLEREHPGEVGPRVLLARSYLQEGSDTHAAEQSLRRVLLLDPAYAEAQNNLAVLLRNKSREEDDYFAARGEMTGWLLGEHYQAACTNPSDLQPHLPALRELAVGCGHVTDVGTGRGLAALAFLAAQPGRLVCVDLVRTREAEGLRALAGQTELEFVRADALTEEIEETDLLFLDLGDAAALLRAAPRLAGKARQRVALHGDRADAAAEALTQQGAFRITQRWDHGGVLVVLARIGPDSRSEH